MSTPTKSFFRTLSNMSQSTPRATPKSAPTGASFFNLPDLAGSPTPIHSPKNSFRKESFRADPSSPRGRNPLIDTAVVVFSHYLGIDLEEEKELFWIAEEALQNLPRGNATQKNSL